MFANFLGQHQLLVRDYPGAPPTPAAPPAPAPTVAPPPAVPLAFAVVARPSLFGIVGAAIGSTTLATVTCTDTSATIRQSTTVPGLTLSYAGNMLSVAGTPTGNAAVYRVVVTYVASDGYTALGSSEHDVTIANASQVLTIGSAAGIAGRVGQPLSVTICSPTSNYAVDVLSRVNTTIAGLTATWAWTRGASTGAGTLTLAGTPTEEFSGAFVFGFTGNGLDLGASTAGCIIAPRYEAAPPPPAASPAPTPPAPSPPPVPSPAPSPGAGADPYRAQTKVLLHFNADLTGLTIDPAIGAPTLGQNDAATGATSFSTAYTTQQTNPGLGHSVLLGVPDTGLEAVWHSRMEASIAGVDGSDGNLTVECMVDIDETTWNALTAAGAGERYCPVLSALSPSGAVLWSLGFGSWIVRSGYTTSRIVVPLFYTELATAYYADALSRVAVIGPTQPSRPARFVHFAGCRKAVSTTFQTATWFDGRTDLYYATDALSKLITAATSTVTVGGETPGVVGIPYSATVQQIPFSGAVDEVRVTAAARYASHISINPVDLQPYEHVVPWPNN